MDDKVTHPPTHPPTHLHVNHPPTHPLAPCGKDRLEEGQPLLRAASVLQVQTFPPLLRPLFLLPTRRMRVYLYCALHQTPVWVGLCDPRILHLPHGHLPRSGTRQPPLHYSPIHQVRVQLPPSHPATPPPTHPPTSPHNSENKCVSVGLFGHSLAMLTTSLVTVGWQMGLSVPFQVPHPPTHPPTHLPSLTTSLATVGWQMGLSVPFQVPLPPTHLNPYDQ